jgi:uncharacterized protein YjiS (DUF1127 family)
MHAPVTKDQFTFSLGNASYVDYSYDEPPARVIETPKRGIRPWLTGFAAKVVDWQRRRAVMREMAMMTERELADIGLTRSDLPRVFDPVFAADRARARDDIAY